MQKLLSELGQTAKNANVFFENSQGAIALANNLEHYTRTKHINIQYHFVLDCVDNGKVKLKYCPIAEMVADALTKPLSKSRHHEIMEKIPDTISRVTQKIKVGKGNGPNDHNALFKCDKSFTYDHNTGWEYNVS